MSSAADLTRLAVALVYSGIIWGTVLFLINACALDRRVPFLGVGVAVAVLAVTVYLFIGVVASQDLFAMAK